MVLDSARQAWDRTRLMLFRDFAAAKWFTLGFTAWLMHLPGGGTGRMNLNFGQFPFRGMKREKAPEAMRSVMDGLSWLQENINLISVFAILAVIVGLIILIVCLWASSRGHFIFLDNVACDRVLIKDPWHRFQTVGDSLFFWRIGFGVAVVAVLALLGTATVLAFISMKEHPAMLVAGILSALFLLGALLAAGVITVLLYDFVVPLMYRYNMTAMAAWSYFYDLFRIHIGTFIVFLVARMVLQMLVALLIVAIIIATCCVAMLLFSIPIVGSYLNAVVFLPVYVFFRTFSVVFLEKFHPDYRMLQPPACIRSGAQTGCGSDLEETVEGGEAGREANTSHGGEPEQ